MIHLQDYSKPELTAMFGTRGVENLKRKLERYGIDFDTTGRGENTIFKINNIENEFKIFCITDLHFDANVNFQKVQNLYYHFFNDEVFSALPDEVKEYQLRAMDKDVSRQSIARYLRRLERNNLINRHTNNFIYYFAYGHTQRFVEKEEYLEAWKEYYGKKDDGTSSFDAIMEMYADYGGVARKQAIPEINGIYNEEIEYMLSLIQKNIEKDYAQKLSQSINTNIMNDNIIGVNRLT